MPRLTPDQSFYPSPIMAMAAAPEKLAYVALLNPDAQKTGVGDNAGCDERRNVGDGVITDVGCDDRSRR